jgi:hypothetical protein
VMLVGVDRDTQILAYMGGEETKEGIIRVVFGNTPDTSKALRLCAPAPCAAYDLLASKRFETLSNAMRVRRAHRCICGGWTGSRVRHAWYGRARAAARTRFAIRKCKAAGRLRVAAHPQRPRTRLPSAVLHARLPLPSSQRSLQVT